MATDPATRLCGMLGFAMRAGKILIGTDIVCRAMAKERGAPSLVLVCSDASEGTRKKVFVKSAFYGIVCISLPLCAETLGALLGKTYNPATIAVCDPGFAAQIEAAARALNKQ